MLIIKRLGQAVIHLAWLSVMALIVLLYEPSGLGWLVYYYACIDLFLGLLLWLFGFGLIVFCAVAYITGDEDFREYARRSFGFDGG